MKYLTSSRSLLLLAGLLLPITGFGKDKHKGHDHDDHRDHGSRDYRRPYAYVAPRPYYYRPSVGISVYSRPLYYSNPTYYRGVPNSSVYADELAVDVQRALARRGYYRGPIDGDIGPGTRSAIRAYQYDRRLEVTGRVDRTLLRSLGVS